MTDAPQDRIIDHDIPADYEPSPEEVREYAKWIGMDVEDPEHQDLFWIARLGVKAPLPEGWKEVRTADTDEAYYFHTMSGESMWDHPCDDRYRTLFKQEQQKAKVQRQRRAPGRGRGRGRSHGRGGGQGQGRGRGQGHGREKAKPKPEPLESRQLINN